MGGPQGAAGMKGHPVSLRPVPAFCPHFPPNCFKCGGLQVAALGLCSTAALSGSPSQTISQGPIHTQPSLLWPPHNGAPLPGIPHHCCMSTGLSRHLSRYTWHRATHGVQANPRCKHLHPWVKQEEKEPGKKYKGVITLCLRVGSKEGDLRKTEFLLPDSKS